MTKPAHKAPLDVSTGGMPFDTGKVQYEANRRRRRKKLMLWSAPAVLLVLALSLWFGLPEPLTARAITNYRHQSYPIARNWLTPLTWTSPQPFIIAFNSGTVDTQLGRYDKAQAELTKALALAPANRRCMVLQNLAISLDDHAAYLQRQPSLGEDASTYSNQADSIRGANPKCFPATTKKPNGPGGGGGSGSDQAALQILTATQQQQLQQKNQQGDQFQQPDFQQNAYNENNPEIKPW